MPRGAGVDGEASASRMGLPSFLKAARARERGYFHRAG
jgi:hypothetical protein